uniref:Signal recognition particle SRP72 subunit RNA-binding domain-containing protein n=1 Tax=Solanum lycopersicum TaxID=4081 RepID=K4AVD8_SOLLC
MDASCFFISLQILRNTQEDVASYTDFFKRNWADEFLIMYERTRLLKLKKYLDKFPDMSKVILLARTQTAAHADIEKAEAYAKQLKPLPSLEKTSSAEKGPNVGATETYEAKRKSKYLKGFDPANPEKWIPKRERSSYKPKKKDKRAAQIRASQQRALIVIRSQTSQLIQKFLPGSNPTNVSSLLFP